MSSETEKEASPVGWWSNYFETQDEAIVTGIIVGVALIIIAAIGAYLKNRLFPPNATTPPKSEPATQPTAEPTAPQPTPPAPRRKNVDIPAPNPNYTGRAQKLDEITAALNSGYSSAIVGVGGMGGVGKTETAQVIAHRLLESGRYSDGAMMIDLQGFSESGTPPLSATAALTTLLTRRGVKVGAPPDGNQDAFADALAAKWREVTTDRDMLVILDNAHDGEQVRPLLPGKGATALITSRHSIRLPQVQEVALEKLNDDDARDLIEKLCPDLEEADIITFLRIADGLPLLIETAAPFLNDADGRSTAAKLADYQAAGGDKDALGKLLARLDLSIAALSADDASHYAALPRFERGFHARWAATLWGEGQAEAEKRLARFHRRNLIIQADSAVSGDYGARWRLHDHMRAAASARLWDDPQATAWRQGWLKAGLEMMEIAGDLYNSHGDGIAAGLALLDQELATIRAVATASAHDAPTDDIAADVAMRLPNYAILNLRLSPAEQLEWLHAGIPAAERLDDKVQQAVLIGNAAIKHAQMGDLDQAEGMYRKGLVLDEALDRKGGLATKYGNLGILYFTRGDLDQAEEMYRRSLELDEAMDRKVGMANQYGNLGNLYQERGALDQAEDMHRRSLELNEAMGRKEGMAIQYFNLAALRRDQSRAADALPYAEQARALFAEIGMKPQLAKADDLIAKIKGHLPD